ncbi:hypothetical protein BC830DRAFT_793671 [Chytriomyces sp. MP71]|nr:hypothetical protein BC830DRAFT_793671 [Chytriomyces sp. MP71]
MLQSSSPERSAFRSGLSKLRRDSIRGRFRARGADRFFEVSCADAAEMKATERAELGGLDALIVTIVVDVDADAVLSYVRVSEAEDVKLKMTVGGLRLFLNTPPAPLLLIPPPPLPGSALMGMISSQVKFVENVLRQVFMISNPVKKNKGPARCKLAPPRPKSLVPLSHFLN